MGEPLVGAVASLNVGLAGTLIHRGREVPSAFVKRPVETQVWAGPLGLEGDEQVGDYHGGPDKALCVYPFEHHAHWEDVHDLHLPGAAAFGENLTTTGLLETTVRIGDVFRVGGALAQVTQPRGPCYKIAARYGISTLPVELQEANLTGWYLRVLEPGWIEAGAHLELVRRGAPAVTVALANHVLNVDKQDLAGARLLVQVDGLADRARTKLRRRIGGEHQGPDLARLHG